MSRVGVCATCGNGEGDRCPDCGNVETCCGSCGCRGAKCENETLVVLESMPKQHRSSHRAANNFGVYPHNGASRYVMPRVEAEEVVESDEDGYDRIVRAATNADIERYGTDARPEGW